MVRSYSDGIGYELMLFSYLDLDSELDVDLQLCRCLSLFQAH
jgi:hypothetical protein